MIPTLSRSAIHSQQNKMVCPTMLLRSMTRFGGIGPFLRHPLSRLPSTNTVTLSAKRTASTQSPKGPPHPNSKTSQSDSDDKNNTGSTRPPRVATPLETFFSQFAKFQYRPSLSPFAEFNRLCKEYKWEKDNTKRENIRDGFNLAIKKEFDNLYGSDENDVENWRRLCHVLKIDPVPVTLGGCRAVVRAKHVNLVDLLEYLRVKGKKEEVQIFSTEIDLSKYTNATGKYFPKEDARDGGVLRALRRHILDPQGDPPPKRQSRRTAQK